MKQTARHARWVALMVWALTASQASPASPDDAVYQIVYGATLDPATQRAEVRIAVRQSRALLRHVRFDAPRDRYLSVHGQGDVAITADHIDWSPPADGGVLHFEYAIDHVRDSGGQDARITETWALLKLDRLFPPAKVRVLKGAKSDGDAAPDGAGRLVDRDAVRTRRRSHATRSTIRARTSIAPKAGCWRGISSRYVATSSRTAASRLAVPKGRGSDRTTCWRSCAGRCRRWCRSSRSFRERLLIVSGPDSMWRGGLSGSGSIYLHADRPLISQNGTSTPLHEMVHVASGLHGSRRCGLDRRRNRRVLQPRRAAPLEHDQRSALPGELRHARQMERRQQVRRDGSIGGHADGVRGRRDARARSGDPRGDARRQVAGRSGAHPVGAHMYRLPTRASARQQPN